MMALTDQRQAWGGGCEVNSCSPQYKWYLLSQSSYTFWQKGKRVVGTQLIREEE